MLLSRDEIPLSGDLFSQINGVMLETMCTTALALLGPLAGRTLLDLYCGYGLFSLAATAAKRRE